MALALSAIRDYARVLAQDTDSSNYGITNANMLTIINEIIAWQRARMNDRVHAVGGTAAFNLVTGMPIGTKSLSTIVYDLSDILSVHLETTTTSTNGMPLERIEVPEMLDLHATETATGTPKRWCAYRPTTTPAGATQGAWTVLIHPAPSTTGHFISVRARRVATALASDTDKPDLSDAECYLISRIVAVEAARLLGRDASVIENILRFVPDDVQTALQLAEGQLRPRKRPGEVAE